MSQSPNLPPSLHTQLPWNPNPGAIWGATSLLLRRNLARYNFPAKLEKSDAEQVLSHLKEALLQAVEGSTFFPEKGLSSQDRQLIYEHFLLLQSLPQSPNGGGVILDPSGTFLASINMGNHLELRVTSPTDNWEELWNRLAKLEDGLGKKEDFAFHPKFGYLTADPAECGTGLSVYVYLHLPALCHMEKLSSAISNIEGNEVELSGLTGNLEDLVGDTLIVQNRYTLGMSEEAILHAIQGAVTKIISAEKMLREHLKNEKNAQIIDLISKAYGLLLHSHKLEVKEALDLLSLMKFGLEIGLISGVSDEKLSSLFFRSRKGHLCSEFPEVVEPEKIEQKRADFLQKELQGITFHD